MATLVFGIETIGEPWNSLDAITKQSLTQWIDRVVTTEGDKIRHIERVKKGLGLSPFTGSIFILKLYDVERAQGVVYHTFPVAEGVTIPAGYVLKERTEKEIVDVFWQGVREYDTVVTFNGRTFTVPFLLHRALAHDVTPYRPLVQKLHSAVQGVIHHVDMMDECTLNGALSKRPTLHMLCRTYGIESPVPQLKGQEVTQLYNLGDYKTLLEYSIKKSQAIVAMYQYWQKHMNVKVE